MNLKRSGIDHISMWL